MLLAQAGAAQDPVPETEAFFVRLAHSSHHEHAAAGAELIRRGADALPLLGALLQRDGLPQGGEFELIRAIRGLGEAGAPLVADFERWLARERGREGHAHVLLELGDAGIEPYLRRRAGDRSPAARISTLSSYAAQHPAVMRAIVRALASDDAATRTQAENSARWLRDAPPRFAVAVWAELATDPAEAVRRECRAALVVHGQGRGEAVAGLQRALAAALPGERRDVAAMFGAAGAAALPALREPARDPAASTRLDAVAGFAQAGAAADGDLLALLDDPDAEVRAAAIAALGRRDATLVARLLPLLAEPLRAAAALQVLLRLGPAAKEAAAAVRGCADAADHAVRTLARLVLEGLGGG